MSVQRSMAVTRQIKTEAECWDRGERYRMNLVEDATRFESSSTLMGDLTIEYYAEADLSDRSSLTLGPVAIATLRQVLSVLP